MPVPAPLSPTSRLAPKLLKLHDRTIAAVLTERPKPKDRVIRNDFDEKPSGKYIKTVPELQVVNAADGAAYPDTWDKACMWDHHNFTSKPVGCPVRFDDRRNIVHLHGKFCSWNCALSWGKVYLPSTTQSFVNMWINMIVRRIVVNNNKRTKDNRIDPAQVQVVPAADWILLDRFSANGMTIDEFRSAHCRSVRLVTMPDYLHIVPSGVNVFEIPYPPSQQQKQQQQQKKQQQQQQQTKRRKTAATAPTTIEPADLKISEELKRAAGCAPDSKVLLSAQSCSQPTPVPSAPSSSTTAPLLPASRLPPPVPKKKATSAPPKGRNSLYRKNMQSAAWKLERQKPQSESVLKKLMKISKTESTASKS
jgi:hypothetical protein